MFHSNIQDKNQELCTYAEISGRTDTEAEEKT